MFDASRRRFRLSTYRRPERWETMKRVALVGGVTLALGLKSRKAFKGALTAHHAGQHVGSEIRTLKRVIAAHGDTPHRVIRPAIDKLMERRARIRSTQRALSRRGNRFSTSAKIVGGVGIGYAGMPYARKRGIQNNLKWQRQQWGR